MKKAPARKIGPAARTLAAWPGLPGLAEQEAARRAGLSRLRRKGGITMANRRVGLCFKDWQLAILQELARSEGFEHVATFITRDIVKLYPTLKRRPLPDGRQMDLLEPARGIPRAGGRAAPRAAGKASAK